MKKKIVLLAAAVFLLAAVASQTFGASARTVEGVENADFTLTGTATVNAPADECRFYGNIEIAANDLVTAEETGEAVYGKVRAAFAPYGSTGEINYRVYPSYEQIGYTYTRCLCFTITPTEKQVEARRALADAGITSMDGVTFVCRDETAYRNEALMLAVENARQKAAALNPGGELVSVEELSCYSSYCDFGITDSGRTVAFTATVRAVFSPSEYREAELG